MSQQLPLVAAEDWSGAAVGPVTGIWAQLSEYEASEFRTIPNRLATLPSHKRRSSQKLFEGIVYVYPFELLRLQPLPAGPCAGRLARGLVA